MIKQRPSARWIAAMVGFALSCAGILMFLWLSFGGSIPLRPHSYRFQVAIPQAATLVDQADVRIAGVNVGKVVAKQDDKSASRSLVTIELKPKYAPVPKDTRAILRQKTLLGETYVQLSPGDRSSGMLADGGRLPNGQVEGTTQLDEIFSSFDAPTRRAFQDWQAELARAFRGGRGQDLNGALGNLEGFSVGGAKLLRVLDDQGVALHRLIRNTGQTFGAINEREGALRQLITGANETFQATASRDQALAQTIQVLPTFLSQTRATLLRLDRFAHDTRPVVNELKVPASELGPTVTNLGALAPDLETFFSNVRPLERASRSGLPALSRVLRGASPLVDAAHPFFRQLNPILSLLNFDQATVAAFLSDGAGNIPLGSNGYRQINDAMFDQRTFVRYTTRPSFERGNSYAPASVPNYLTRAPAFGVIESFDCNPSGGEVRNPVDVPPAGQDPVPPCFVQPPSLYDHKEFPLLRAGKAPNVPAPKGTTGVTPARP